MSFPVVHQRSRLDLRLWARGAVVVAATLTLVIFWVWVSQFYHHEQTDTTQTAQVAVPDGAQVFRGNQRIIASIATLPTLAEFQSRTDHPIVMINPGFDGNALVEATYVGVAKDDNRIFGFYQVVVPIVRDTEGRYVASYSYDPATATVTTTFGGHGWLYPNSGFLAIGIIGSVVILVVAFCFWLGVGSRYSRR